VAFTWTDGNMKYFSQDRRFPAEIRSQRPLVYMSEAVVFKLFLFAYPTCNFSSTLYPQNCWSIIRVLHSL
jgi:hypothetical protein